ncbi:MBL fold metallo-hydrolase [Streptococcus sp. zg-JUN1979]|uniref:MBL fold metallo-hydrolase n=1 Tax=Streptococcus sp. zg-JUN1979 TaxID=3391450 RepID=UPI0039A616D8
MKLITIGCWGGYPYKDAGTTSYLLSATSGFQLLIDVGSRAVNELEKELSPLDLDAVIISHYHPDHIADLGVLYHYRQLYPKHLWEPKVLPVYGHDEEMYEFSKLSLDGVAKGIPYHTEGTEQIGPFDITFIKTVHPVVCYAMRIVERETSQVLVFTGDTGYFADLASFSKGADLLLADVYLFEGHEKHPAHLTSKEAGEIAAKAKVKRLVLTHLPQFPAADIPSDNHLEVLRQQAQQYSKGVPVDLASPHVSWDLGQL